MKKKKSTASKYFSKEKVIFYLKDALKLAVIFLIITSGVIESSTVPTPSMEKTIMVGDKLLVNKFLFGPASPRYIPFTNIELPYFQLPSFREPRRDDILVFIYPGDRDQMSPDEITLYVKRCVAGPGDTLLIKSKVVFVNGEEFPIPPDIQYLAGGTKPKNLTERDIFPKNSNWNSDNYGPLVIPYKGMELEMDISNIEYWRTLIDREYGKKSVKVSGDEIFINGIKSSKYTFQKDYFFMMGDNRDNSLDSRYWGPVARDLIVGTPVICYWSWDSDIPFSRPLDLINSIRWDRIAKLIY